MTLGMGAFIVEFHVLVTVGKWHNGWHHWGAASNVDFKFGTDGNSDGCFC